MTATIEAPTTSDEIDQTNPRVLRDLVAGFALIGAVVGGHLLWHAFDVGIVAALGAR